MSKAIMKGVEPKLCQEIITGNCNFLLSKTKPKLETPFKCFIYETRDKHYSIASDEVLENKCARNLDFEKLNVFIRQQKVIGEFVCDKIYEITPHCDILDAVNQYICGWKYEEGNTCLTFDETHKYLKGKSGYSWHISKLKIYKKPKTIKQFYKHDPSYDNSFGWVFDDKEKRTPLTVAPRLGFHIYVEEI